MIGSIFDTNHLSQSVIKGSVVAQRILDGRRRGDVFGTCVPVLCEIEAGLHCLDNPQRYRRSLDQIMRHVRIWPMDARTAQIYGELANALRRKGRVLLQVDMMIAALARQMNLRILTSDRDFEALPDVRTENWIIQ